jgi:hypothetical protein
MRTWRAYFAHSSWRRVPNSLEVRRASCWRRVRSNRQPDQHSLRRVHDGPWILQAARPVGGGGEDRVKILIVSDPSEGDSSRHRNRQVFRRYLAVLVAPVAGILLALALGISPQRLRRAVEFQAVALAAAVYFMMALRWRARTAKRQRHLESLVGIRFTTPFWMTLMEATIPIEVGGALAAVFATLGLPGVGNGVFITFALFALALPWFKSGGLQPRSIVLERHGLQIFMSRATFLVPWTSIAHIESMGPEHFVALNLTLKDSESILDSAQPPDSKAREQIKMLMQSSRGGGAQVFLMPWVGGLDGRALERGIRAGIKGTAPGMN